MWKVLRTAYSWRERLYGCRVNKEFERLTTIEHIDILIANMWLTVPSPRKQ